MIKFIQSVQHIVSPLSSTIIHKHQNKSTLWGFKLVQDLLFPQKRHYRKHCCEASPASRTVDTSNWDVDAELFRFEYLFDKTAFFKPPITLKRLEAILSTLNLTIQSYVKRLPRNRSTYHAVVLSNNILVQFKRDTNGHQR